MKTLAEVPEKKIKRGEIEIAYWVVGEGTPIVLITGLATPAVTWHVLPALLASSGYRVLVIDNRDCGNSSPCDGIDYAISDMADDVEAVMSEVGFESAYVFGISMGGMIAQELALNHPNRVKKLILVATNPGGSQSVVASAEVLTDVLAPSPSGNAIEGMALMLGRLMGPGFAESNEDLINRLAELRVKHGSDAKKFARQWQAILEFGTWERLPNLKVPTLVIHGDSDPLVPYENGKNLAARIPGARLITLPGVGHFVPLENPQDTVSAIIEFFPVEAPVVTVEPVST